MNAIRLVMAAKAKEAALEACYSAAQALALGAQAFGIRRRRMAPRVRVGARRWRRVPLTTRQRARCATQAATEFAKVAAWAAGRGVLGPMMAPKVAE